MDTQIPILTYHANNINGLEHQNNDHIALEQNLKVIDELGFRVISISQLMAWRLGKVSDRAVEKTVVLTCDDGTWFDYYDVDHPTHGQTSSFFNLLKAHQNNSGQTVSMTSFVIVSPEARIILDQKCLVGKGWWTDEWWENAQQSGLMSISNHSWDHNHGVLNNNNVNDDSFRCINDRTSCDRQIKQAQQFLQQRLGKQATPYFAYPYGNFSDYLRYEYLPRFGRELGLVAAFTTEPKHVTKFSKLWALPRYVCNNDWHNSDELIKILKNH